MRAKSKQAFIIERMLRIRYPEMYSIGLLPNDIGDLKFLQTEILEKLLPLLSPKNMPELLYIGDASKRKLVLKTERLKELGINVFEDSSCLPDIVAYDKSSKRILFVEAYYSGGAFDVGRVDKILKLCKCEPGTEAEFVTAFDTTAKMLKAYKEVAWDTDIWTADEPTHLTHKNGDKLIGRKL